MRIKPRVLCGSTSTQNRRRLQIDRKYIEGTLLPAIKTDTSRDLPQINRSLPPADKIIILSDRGLNRVSVKKAIRHRDFRVAALLFFTSTVYAAIQLL